MRNIIAIILAAGKGTRMKSAIPKVLHSILGRSIISYISDAVKEANISYALIIAGHGSELLKKAMKGTKILIQKELTGSASAVLTAKKFLGDYSGDILVICGDTPLIKSDTIRKLVEKHKESKASLTILTAKLKNPTGYGRILRKTNGRIFKIAEEGETGLLEDAINEVNVGTYCFKAKDLFDALVKVKPDNKKKEFFLTDTIGILATQGKEIDSVILEGIEEMIGINTRKDLAVATRILKDRVMDELMSAGVTIEDPASTTICPGVKIGNDTVIHSNTIIESDVKIGRNCRIGPFARLRPGVRLADDVEVGNFVELVRTKIDKDTKVKHHTYLGDTTVGKNVNIGAGTITANFDGKNKNKTVIEDASSIGVGTILIAPVHIGRGAVVGAGAVVPRDHDVPPLATVIGIPARIIKRRRP